VKIVAEEPEASEARRIQLTLPRTLISPLCAIRR
jgi:hypothetical protein